MIGAQAFVETLSSYSWALLIIAFLIVLVFVLAGPVGTETVAPAVCTIQPLFPCLDSVFGMISNNHVPYYVTFVNDLQQPMYFPVNSFNLTSGGIGSLGTVATIGSCTPQLANHGTQIYCSANVPGTYEPSPSTKISVIFSFTYELCSKDVKSSCASSLYTTTGYATQEVASANTANIP